MKLLILSLAAAFAAPASPDAPILIITGASCVEELSSETMERFSALESHPLNLNTAREPAIRSSGLLSDYQTATLLDYIARCGEILSYAELAAVDGFGAEFAEALKPYTSLELSGAPGSKIRRGHSVSIQLRASDRTSYEDGVRYNGKVEAGYGDRCSVSAAAGPDGLTSASAVWRTRGGWTVTAGSFHARFGQGLAQWSGFRITTLGTVSSFVLNPSGVSSALSYSESLTGGAAEYRSGRWRLSAYGSTQGRWGLDCTRLTRTATLSASILRTEDGWTPSVSGRATLGRFTVFGEAVPGAALLGSFCNFGYRSRAAVRLALASPSSVEAAAGCRLGPLEGVASYVSGKTEKHRYFVRYRPTFTVDSLTITPEVRLGEAWRPADKVPWRSEGRLCVSASGGRWSAAVRLDGVLCDGLHCLAYAEYGLTSPLKLYLRGTVFAVDSWPGRIYVYERDVAGTFNVPAYYGRGWSVSVFAGWKWISLRLARTAYPWTEGKETKFEARLQAEIRI